MRDMGPILEEREKLKIVIDKLLHTLDMISENTTDETSASYAKDSAETTREYLKIKRREVTG